VQQPTRLLLQCWSYSSRSQFLEFHALLLLLRLLRESEISKVKARSLLMQRSKKLRGGGCGGGKKEGG
jgi:hypothetical protein